MEEDDEFCTTKENAGSNIIVFWDVAPCSLGQISHDISLYPPPGRQSPIPIGWGRLSGPQNLYVRFGGEKKSPAPAGFLTMILRLSTPYFSGFND